MKKQPDKGKITALYERLSHDDERAGESVSIENQKRILEDYAQKNGFTNIRHFTDDGVRGTTFKRPGLDAMLEEIRAGNVATVIIKDQSRIGRDVVEVGLLKRTFDEYHVRFIAANDNLDTANGFDIMSIFRDVINEWYVADTSRKIKTVFKSRMEKGLRCSGSVSYGYLASRENKGEWVIDEEAAAVVRRIFHSVVAGESIASIARALRTEKIPIPSEHWKRIGAPVRAAKYTDPYAWSTTTISYILKRPEYTGRKVLGKTVCENYKTKSTRKTAPEEQYILRGDTRHCGRGNMEHRPAAYGDKTPRPQAADHLKPLDRASLLRRLRREADPPQQPCARQVSGRRFCVFQLPPAYPRLYHALYSHRQNGSRHSCRNPARELVCAAQ